VVASRAERRGGRKTRVDPNTTGRRGCDVFTLRCTRTLLARLRTTPAPDDKSPSTRLGDWYANLLARAGWSVVLFVSGRSLLPVVVAAKEASTLVPRFRASFTDVLKRLGVAAAAVDRELAEMDGVRIGRTRDRQVLGSMNDFAYLLRARRGAGSSLNNTALALELADAPCGPLGMRRPSEVTLELLEAAAGA
jgi:hypothetical protein